MLLNKEPALQHGVLELLYVTSLDSEVSDLFALVRIGSIFRVAAASQDAMCLHRSG